MSAIKLTILGLGSGQCALTAKPESDGLTVAFEGEAPCFLSRKAFWQILSMRAAQTHQAEARSAVTPRPAPPVATLANGPAVAAK